MRVEKINENKIKVLIGSSEAKELNITEKMIAYNTPEESVCLLPKYVPNKSLRRR